MLVFAALVTAALVAADLLDLSRRSERKRGLSLPQK